MDEPQNYSLPLCRLLVNILYSGTISYILMSLYENYIFCDEIFVSLPEASVAENTVGPSSSLFRVVMVRVSTLVKC